MKKFLVVMGVLALALWIRPASAEMQNFITYTADGAGISIDAKGLDNNTEGTISATIPTGAQVYKAYLYSASVGYSGVQLSDVVFEGNTLTSNSTSRLDVGAKNANDWVSENRWDVTSFVQAKVGSGSGTFSFGLKETGYLDGEILAVLYNVPTNPLNTAFLFDGELSTTGDNFSIFLTKPVDKTDPNYQAVLSLGISYGSQGGGGTGQYSLVDVNGQRLTTSAGGEDDGFNANGGLITAGGIGDSLANPADPNLSNQAYRYDDELYSLNSFITNGDTQINFRTLNPSNDDNVFFSAFTTLGEAQTNNVPEPATMLFLGSGLLGLVGLRRKFKK